MSIVIRSKVAQHNLATSEMSKDFGFGFSAKLVTVYLKSSLPITEEVSVWYISADGEEYNTQLDSKILSAESSYFYAVQGDIAINEDDKIRVCCTNANEVGAIFATVKVEV